MALCARKPKPLIVYNPASTASARARRKGSSRLAAHAPDSQSSLAGPSSFGCPSTTDVLNHQRAPSSRVTHVFPCFVVLFSRQENAKIDTVRSLAEGLEDGYPVVEDDDVPMEE